MGTVTIQGNEQDKYAFDKEVKIDCTSRIHICKAVCCRLDFALPIQNIEEGIIKLDLDRPCMIAEYGDGYCWHKEDL